MKKAPIPENEAERLMALKALRVLDTGPEESFDQITRLAATICQSKISLVSLIDSDRQWFKSKFGLQASETARDVSFCGHAIMGDQVFEVSDAKLHPDFCDNPLFINEPHVRFYAGAPLVLSSGHRIGTLCVIDSEAKKLNDIQLETLRVLAKQIVSVLELRQHEEWLQQSYDELEQAQRIAKIGSWRFGPITFEQSWSSEHYRIFEISEPQPQEILYKMYRERIHPDDIRALDFYVNRAREQGIGFVYDHRVVLDGGKRIKYVQGIGNVVKDESGKVVMITGTCRDRTLDEQKDNQIAKSERRLTYALDATGEGVWDWDIVNNLVHHNQQWCKHLGLDDGFLVHEFNEFANRAHPEDRESIVQALQKCLNENCDYQSEHRMRRNDGSYIWVHDRGRVVERDANNKPLRMVGSFKDITEIREAQVKVIQASKLASLGEMSAGVAHEINNPLAIIEGNARLIKDNLSNLEFVKTKIAVIEKASQRIAKIVTGLRKFSRTSEKKQHHPKSIKSLLNEAIGYTELKAKRGAVSVQLNCATEESIACNDLEIEQVFVNLINNSVDAVKTLEERWIKIDVQSTEKEVVVRVRDSGRGVPKNIAEKMFQPFFTTKSIGEGTGLGLSITKGILDEHRASIELVSKDANTCFEIKFPKYKDAQNAA